MRGTTSSRGPPFESEVAPPPVQVPWNPWTEQPGQLYSWTCAACSEEFVERASGHGRSGDVYANREQVVYAIGYPGNINSQYGLMDGSGAQLQRVLLEYAGLDSEQSWLDFDQALDIYSETPGLMSGAAFYHWVAVRGVQGNNLWVANSAPGYKGIYDTISRADWDRLGGWSCIWLT
jgi:hypothetical protein